MNYPSNQAAGFLVYMFAWLLANVQAEPSAQQRPEPETIEAGPTSGFDSNPVRVWEKEGKQVHGKNEVNFHALCRLSQKTLPARLRPVKPASSVRVAKRVGGRPSISESPPSPAASGRRGSRGMREKSRAYPRSSPLSHPFALRCRPHTLHNDDSRATIAPLCKFRRSTAIR
jgi:hypothetical protein